MLYREIIAVCSQIHTKHINTLCGQKVELLNVKPGGTYSDHWALKAWQLPGMEMSPNDITICPNLQRGFEPTPSTLDWFKNANPLHLAAQQLTF